MKINEKNRTKWLFQLFRMNFLMNFYEKWPEWPFHMIFLMKIHEKDKKIEQNKTGLTRL